MKPGDHVYLMGICGTAMASLAGILKSQGFQVSGSDSHPYPPMSTQLAELGIPVLDGYSAENLQPRPDFVIVGNVISRDHVEVQEMLRLNIPYTSLPQCLGENLLRHRETIVVAGTHGKTTTTSMMAWVLKSLGQDPSFLVGGIPKNFGLSFHLGTGSHFVIEGDEYDTAFFDKVPKFVHYHPRYAILTSVEFDHADIYKDLEHVKSAFAELLKKIPIKTGLLVCRADDKNIQDLIKHYPGQIVTFGTNQGDLRAQQIHYQAHETTFEVYQGEHRLGQVVIQLPGEFNVMNAMAVIALTLKLGFSFNKICDALMAFQGVKRRQELIGNRDGLVILEDFAHHPTAVKETLLGLRARYPERRLVAVFEPRSATSRRKVFQKDFAASLSLADAVLVSRPFDQSRIAEDNRFSTEDLLADIQKIKSGLEFIFTGPPQAILTQLQTFAKPGDTVVFMSNGGFEGIHQQFAKGK